MIREYIQTAGKMWTGQARTEAYGTVLGVVPDLQDLDDLSEGMSSVVLSDIQLTACQLWKRRLTIWRGRCMLR
jgi:ABC-type branched-subunit amino acid transport system ATPase component